MEDYKERIISLMASDEWTDEEKAKLRKAFPELVESEDEKIRKRIIAFLRSPFVMNDIADDIIAPWIAYLEKVKDFDKQLEQAYKNSDEVQYKRGYDDGYLEGIVSAKRELEKQGEMDIEMDIEKPITIGKRQLTGKAKELYDNLDAESLEETKEKMLAETNKWTKDDEKICQKYIIEMLAKIDAVEYESYSKIVDWIDSLRQRLS